MGQVGHPGPVAGRAGGQPLEDEPEEQHRPRREAQRQEEEEREETGDPGPGEETEERPEHPGDRPGRPHQCLDGVGVHGRVAEQGQHPGGEVEEGEGGPAHPLLGHGAEDMEEEHVPQQMQPVAVHEESGERGEQPTRRAVPELLWHHAPAFEVGGLRDQQIAGAPVGALGGGQARRGAEQEDGAAEADEGVGDQGSGPAVGRWAPARCLSEHGQIMAYGQQSTQSASPGRGRVARARLCPAPHDHQAVGLREAPWR